LERHRFIWLYFLRRTDLFDGRRKHFLHIAPEACFEERLGATLGDGYLTADLFDNRAMVKMDITNIDYVEGSFDVIYCAHVLQHVADDRRALREFARTLKDDGWAIVVVPISEQNTIEDHSVVDPMNRRGVSEFDGFLRDYGEDFADRLKGASFTFTIAEPIDIATGQECIRMGLSEAAGRVYHCSK